MAKKLNFCILWTNNYEQMMVREALNSALDEEMSADPKVFLMGEEVRIIGMALLSSFVFWCFLFWYIFIVSVKCRLGNIRVHIRSEFLVREINSWFSRFFKGHTFFFPFFSCVWWLTLNVIFFIDIQRAFREVWPWESSWYSNHRGFFFFFFFHLTFLFLFWCFVFSLVIFVT